MYLGSLLFQKQFRSKLFYAWKYSGDRHFISMFGVYLKFNEILNFLFVRENPSYILWDVRKKVVNFFEIFAEYTNRWIVK